MPVRQATLIQSIFDFRAVMDPILQPIISSYAPWEAGLDDVLKWIVCEVIGDCYLLFDQTHDGKRKLGPYPEIFDKAKHEFHRKNRINFDRFFCFLIKAPAVYDDFNYIDVIVRGSDLFIGYYTLNVNPPFN